MSMSLDEYISLGKIKPNHRELVEKIFESLSMCSGIPVDKFDLEMTLDDIATIATKIIDENDFIFHLEDMLMAYFNPLNGNSWIYPLPYRHGIAVYRKFLCFGDWVCWFLYEYIKMCTVETTRNSKSSILSGEMYLKGFRK